MKSSLEMCLKLMLIYFLVLSISDNLPDPSAMNRLLRIVEIRYQAHIIHEEILLFDSQHAKEIQQGLFLLGFEETKKIDLPDKI
jgi:hypothetical protein